MSRRRLVVKEFVFDDVGSLVGLKGSVLPVRVFSSFSHRNIFWAEYGLDYCGG